MALSITMGLAFLLRPQVGLAAYQTATEWTGYAAASCLAAGARLGERDHPDAGDEDLA